MTQTQEMEFKTEIRQLLEIITHSIYTSREIFLRELISNASDALDKLRFEQARGADIEDPDAELAIRVATDADARSITITDTGIGMTQEEVIANIGTIAHSGTAAFLAKAKESGADASTLIGRFGVGFYSVFMVAERVVLRTRSATPNAKPVEWISTGQGSYSIRELDEALPRGTAIRIHLKEDAAEFASKDRLAAVIKKHSNFVSFPVYVDGEKVNTVPALWRENKFSITKEQYSEFYRFLTLDSEDPTHTIHINVDAPVQFSALLFIPPKTMDVFGIERDAHGLDLYVRRVLIQSKNKDLIPEYLGFVRGVVDTEDLPLNISRETLQENRVIRKIAQTITKQVLGELHKFAQDQERYAAFWKEHSKRFKMGYADFANQEAFAELLRFHSSAATDPQALISLEEYVGRMQEGQKAIYYISGPSREAIAKNPHVEIFRTKGVELLYLFDPIDEFVMEAVRRYRDFPLEAAENADLSKLENLPDTTPDDAAAATASAQAEDMEALLTVMRRVLKDRVTEVRASKRLSHSPACLVSPDGSTSQMHRIMQILAKDTSIPQKVLEVNPKHPLVHNLQKMAQHSPDDPFLAMAVEGIFEAALLQDGYLADPHSLVERTYRLLEEASAWHAPKE
ncbi:MAG: molecular chaperone HtpG [Desulfomicrobiaceae bacterium]